MLHYPLEAMSLPRRCCLQIGMERTDTGEDYRDKCENLVNLIDEALLHRVSDVVSSIQLTKPEVSSNPTLD